MTEIGGASGWELLLIAIVALPLLAAIAILVFLLVRLAHRSRRPAAHEDQQRT